MQKLVTFVYPIIRTDYIYNSYSSLKRFTEKGTYKVVVIDQSINGLEHAFINDLLENNHLYIRQRNQGFSNASNKGIIQALRWETPYIAVVNDDTQFMYDGWFTDAIEEFKTDPHIVAV